MIVVAAHDSGRGAGDLIHHLAWLRAVIYQIAQDPDFVECLGQGAERIEIAVDVGKNADFHGRMVIEAVGAVQRGDRSDKLGDCK